METWLYMDGLREDPHKKGRKNNDTDNEGRKRRGTIRTPDKYTDGQSDDAGISLTHPQRYYYINGRHSGYTNTPSIAARLNTAQIGITQHLHDIY